MRSFYEVYGTGTPTILLLPTWSIVHSRCWKLQIPYLSRHCRVITFDGRGNGLSDRPTGAAAYSETEFAADAVSVLDATGTDSAYIVGFSAGAQRALLLAAEHPERVDGVVFIGPAVTLGQPFSREEAIAAFDEQLPSYDGWSKFNRHYWLEHYEDFLQYFFAEVFNDPHSTKQIEDSVGWAMETTPETLVDSAVGPGLDEAAVRSLAQSIRCPVLVLSGSNDAIRSPDSARVLAEITRATLVNLEGAGHAPHSRQPVKVNLLLRDFACPPAPPRRWTTGLRRRKRALYISSPSASATRSATLRSPTSCAGSTPTWRSTGSRSTR